MKKFGVFLLNAKGNLVRKRVLKERAEAIGLAYDEERETGKRHVVASSGFKLTDIPVYEKMESVLKKYSTSYQTDFYLHDIAQMEEDDGIWMVRKTGTHFIPFVPIRMSTEDDVSTFEEKREKIKENQLFYLNYYTETVPSELFYYSKENIKKVEKDRAMKLMVTYHEKYQ